MNSNVACLSDGLLVWPTFVVSLSTDGDTVSRPSTEPCLCYNGETRFIFGQVDRKSTETGCRMYTLLALRCVDLVSGRYIHGHMMAAGGVWSLAVLIPGRIIISLMFIMPNPNIDFSKYQSSQIRRGSIIIMSHLHDGLAPGHPLVPSGVSMSPIHAAWERSVESPTGDLIV